MGIFAPEFLRRRGLCAPITDFHIFVPFLQYLVGSQQLQFSFPVLLFLFSLASNAKGHRIPQCPRGWDKQGNACYKVYSDAFARSWNNANKVCQASRASLVSITSSHEQHVVRRLIHRHSDDSYGFWIGLKRSSTNKFS